MDYDIAKNVRGPVWHKMHMLERQMNLSTHDWLWWLDFDTLITNTSVTLESIIDESLRDHPNPGGVDMLLTADW